MSNRVETLGDILLKNIQNNRTPLTDALLRIIIFLVISMLILWGLEKMFEALRKKSDHQEADRAAVSFVFLMIRYMILIAALFILIRSCVAELTASDSPTFQNMILWLHSDTVTIYDYGLKILIALLVFISFNGLQALFFRSIKRKLDARNVDEDFTALILNLVKYILLSFLVVATSLQLMITGGKSLIAIAIFVYICIMVAVPTKQIRNRLSGENKSFELFFTIMGRIMGMVVYVGVIFGLYILIRNFLGSGGRELSPFVAKSEAELATALETKFEYNDDLGKAVSDTLGLPIKIKSDGELNLIYLNKRLIGLNTSGRKYQFFGVSVNEPEITAVHRMGFLHDSSAQEVGSIAEGASRSHYYFDTKSNECLVLTINSYSNRVVSITYYNDFAAVSNRLVLTNDSK